MLATGNESPSMRGRLQKTEAIARMNKAYGTDVLTSRTAHFANINKSKDVWWFDIPLRKISSPVTADALDLLVYDYRDDQLYHLRVPTEFIRKNLRELVVRSDKEVISLELSADKAELFRDLRSKGGKIMFAQFCQNTIFAKPGTIAGSAPIRSTQRAVKSKFNATVSEERITGDDLMKWHRELLRLLDKLDGRRFPDLGPAARINQLSRDGVIPRKIAALMRSLTEARNAAVHEGDEPTATEAVAIENAWKAITDWMKKSSDDTVHG